MTTPNAESVPQWDDADMAESFLAGYVLALTRDDPHAVIAVKLEDIADDFGFWLTEVYEPLALCSDCGEPGTSEEHAGRCVAPCDSCDGLCHDDEGFTCLHCSAAAEPTEWPCNVEVRPGWHCDLPLGHDGRHMYLESDPLACERCGRAIAEHSPLLNCPDSDRAQIDGSGDGLGVSSD